MSAQPIAIGGDLSIRMQTRMDDSTRACRLDRLADCELQAGHHAAAERFAFLAAELREGVHATC